VTKALYVRLEAKPGREREMAAFLDSALLLVEDEPATTAWFALRLGSTEFGILHLFADDAGREAHLAGPVARALMDRPSDLLALAPMIDKIDVVARKLPLPA
jgi:quinol monooxygenase YgiN